jgi:hypothetical protein
MPANKISVQDMLATLQEWHLETTNFRNDGFVQHGYREKLDALHTRIIAIMDTIEMTGKMDMREEAEAKDGKLDPWRTSIRDAEPGEEEPPEES